MACQAAAAPTAPTSSCQSGSDQFGGARHDRGRARNSRKSSGSKPWVISCTHRMEKRTSFRNLQILAARSSISPVGARGRLTGPSGTPSQPPVAETGRPESSGKPYIVLPFIPLLLLPLNGFREANSRTGRIAPTQPESTPAGACAGFPKSALETGHGNRYFRLHDERGRRQRRLVVWERHHCRRTTLPSHFQP